MKKLISIALAIMMILSLATMAFATGTGTNSNTGSITIQDSGKDHTYTIYRIFDLSLNTKVEPNAYAYTVNRAWNGFFGEGSEALNYFTIKDGYVTWKSVDGETDAKKAERAAAFAQLALAYAEENKISAVESKNSTADGKLVFQNLPLGYYLVDSTMGTLLTLDTTAPDAAVKDKNDAPGIDKDVKSDEATTDNGWADSNTASIGDTVEFHVQITVNKGAENYVLHDQMSEGLTYQEVTAVKIGNEDVDDANYTVTDETTDNCTFEVVFDNDYIAGLEAGTVIEVFYSAILNEKAVIAGEGNPNSAQIEYGDKNHTGIVPAENTTTYTYEFDLVKTDSDKKLLDGAKFKLYNVATGGSAIALVKTGDTTYRVAKADDQTTVTEIDVKDGQVTISGLSNGEYWLEETKAPDGYNQLTAREKFTIQGSNLDATVTEGVWEKDGVRVENKTGSELPETGAMGTAIFVSFGTLVVLGTGVLLVTKKRMSMIED